MRFEWDDAKDAANRRKHGLSFYEAQAAFLDPKRLIAEVTAHSAGERRYCCIGRCGDGIATVRFTLRGNTIRLIGAGYWRKGKKAYEKAQQR